MAAASAHAASQLSLNRHRRSIDTLFSRGLEPVPLSRAVSSSLVGVRCGPKKIGCPRAARITGSEREKKECHHWLRLSQRDGGASRGFEPARSSSSMYDAPVAMEDPEEAARLEQASRRVERTAVYFRRLGIISFWGQLVCTTVSAVILSFSIVISGKPTAPISTYLTAIGIAAAFLSVFWSFGYLRLSDRLKASVANPLKAPPRSSVVSNLKNGVLINLLGMGAALLGLQATVGILVAKALTSTYTPFAGGVPAGYSPVMALDVFLVQASGNTLLAHFIGIVLTLELLRATTWVSPPPQTNQPQVS